MTNTKRLQDIINYALVYAESSRAEFVVPEHLLLGMVQVSPEFVKLARAYHFTPADGFAMELHGYLRELDEIPEDVEYELTLSTQTCEVLSDASIKAQGAGKEDIDVPHVLLSMLELQESNASYILHRYFAINGDDYTDFMVDKATVLRDIIDVYDGKELDTKPIPDVYDFDDYDSMANTPSQRSAEWRKLVTCINDQLDHHNPLIGREAELDRTIQVLCRCDKNNPLHIGEPGVGKTALIYGLAERIARGDVPARLQGARIYQVDMGSLVAGTTYRGDFEQRIKSIMEGVSAEENSIVYIDEIHTLVGSGANSENSLDGSNMLKPYLESGRIRFIGATTYKEFNRYFQKSQGLVRRFQQIDILEPSEEETLQILEGLRKRYETFHGVTYAEGVLEHAVKMSSRYITGRFLPDKAIDLIDEAGAFRETHPQMRKQKGELVKQKKQTVDISLINETVRRISKISEQAMEATNSGTEKLATLAERMQQQIFGQDEAIRCTTEAVMVGKAGLLDADKPVASMLFVGPTGVGKTEVCRVLAQELGLELVRFDMSEYTEKHTVAKLIGSPAGYVGYEDGGLLTDAIRKTPNCVLLLDEIEKAHSDIYNILLQVMDYARLTDNKGQKADFRHVILIMTSNAGAQYASQATVGFASQETTGSAMLTAVKKTFKPEFLGRLSATVVFNDLSREMASRILHKKLQQLSSRLSVRKVTMHVSDEAFDLLLKKGFTPKNGARELDRTINAMLTPLLTREILFGKLKDGGEAKIAVGTDEHSLIVIP